MPKPEKIGKRGDIEKIYLAQDISVVGIDEVGKGCLAGPVYAGACILDLRRVFSLPLRQRNLIRDSKTLSLSQREAVLPLPKGMTYSNQ